ncbi:hypothetical protein N657DRAFT_135855 [Parathielavia appendiculata]|uniref:Uncharacterized protein n=1 Tax=Parathielavia appendiculata TaxID=2587402 RepID=A0AAN6Z202_9PEZI|nr:hypothetical protein N657DRAFT_135855 [Parathielavia appendiculata]
MTSQPGVLNWAIFLSFSYGVGWVLRAPHPAGGTCSFLSADYTSRILASEVATLKHVKKHTPIPVPGVFAYR